MKITKFMPYFAYIVGGWVQKEGKFCLRNKSMAPNGNKLFLQLSVKDSVVSNRMGGELYISL